MVHGWNKAADRAIARPVARAYVAVTPEPVRIGIDNLSRTASLPGHVVNNLLQGDIGGAGQNVMRLAVNLTAGFFGVADPASVIGLEAVETDFGETLHVWGVPEGAYISLPGFGPSTERDAAGRVGDLFTNPVSALMSDKTRTLRLGARVLEEVHERGRFADSVDSVLYDSADSYAQSRLLYLQNRRFELGQTGEEAYFDLYEDPYAELE